MKKAKNRLSNNHRRVLSTVLRIIEKDLNEMINLLSNPVKTSSFEVLSDLEEYEKNDKIVKINEILSEVKKIFKEFSFEKEYLEQSKIIESKKTKLWSILEDSYSKKLYRYGVIDPENSIKIDKIIKDLIEKINDI